ncbi:hypothetical protein PPSIR1_16420 [Plesiocystis pacifica SIR-1]|uniref:Tc toxin complex TcA C-terminal TcB-binding domain-containing protein n=1 Tax=Plesiocystis pacifica SIR-1 TaxID=391625 RepID=A6G339_9BACT|nr:neuraminidase-like domain-containing protein [Plesiocystis pacifica]EDM79664.1 hypothetical protein PPSIR1_16420 [Plesiocystis pacifica SIR-1]
MRDAIREQQRDALVDAVLAQLHPRTRHDVFEHLLIDVEMSACMQTSRIKQAISAVQIYVQRVLLHLEAETVVLADDAIERWEWMKNYRVWEANRKVFLYPENWLEPELRGGKTPEFETLEATLMQGVLEDEPIEKALVSYVDRLDRVSRLEIVSVYEEEATGELWVLGRSAGKPYDWFVRRRRNGGAWQAWEEVPHKIDGDAVALVVEQRRAHLFWAEKQSGQQQGQTTFRLSHIERSEDGWGKVTVSDESKPSSYGLPNQRLQVWKGNHHFAIALLVKHEESPTVFVPALFSHDLHDGDIRYRGALLEHSSFHVGESVSSLLNNTLISLQPGYELDGQRYLNTLFTSEPGAQVQGDQVIEGGTHFEQGTFRALLFADRSSSEDEPAMVHQADLWTSEAGDRFRPVVYDDRKRKYLLEPQAVYDLEGASPGALGLAVATDYLGECPPPRAVTPPTARPPRAKTQALKDGLTTLTVWNGVVPGQVEGLEPANTYDAGTLLEQATAIPQAGVGPSDLQNNFPASQTAFTLGIEPLYHPYARDMVETLARQGLPGLYAPAPSSALFRQQGSFDPFTADELDLNPALVDDPASLAHSLEHFDFRFDSPYGLYNWELFFHVPMLVAAKLTAEQRFEEAQRWHHKVFNPIQLVTPGEGESPASGFWRIKPFVEQAAQLAVDQFQAMAGVGVNAAQQAAAIEAFTEQVGVWADNPFDPHAIARIRPGVYQRALLRKYLDNLIAWADQLFARDTIESINEATVLYILVAQLLGDRPQAVPGPQSDAKTFEELDAAGLDAFSNALIELESYIHLPTQALEKLGCDEDIEPGPWARVPVLARSWHFCYPPNAELLKYWDLVDDRLWKIRHCQNIRGVARSLPLFQPPIDPGLLVRATAAGVDIQSVLAELDSGLPPYRFRSVHGRAVAFAGSLRALGGELLSALEKRDAEALARLRSGHELELLDRVLEVREQQLEEARTQLSSLLAAKETVEQRQAHYASLIEGGLSERERAHFKWANHAYENRQMAGGISALGSVLGAIPQIEASLTDPKAEFGGLHLSNIVGAAAGVQSLIAAGFDHLANKAQLYGSFDRRRQDWTLQRDQADKELARLERDLIAAEIRVALAERELDNHKLQLEQSREYDQTMRDKFTNRELYDWMVGQLSTLYFQTYQLAFDLAKRAERAYRHELAITDDQAIIQYGYWDSLRKGLLAGQRLLHDLERLDLAYMDRDIREFELRKSASLAELDPAALRDLQEAGEASFELPELLFDLDHPGHYLRRIRAVRVTIPAVVGPYTSLGARLELEQHSTRVSPQLADTVTGYGGGEAIATSTAVADGGLFNLDFRDERYLPFEYAGAASAWKLTLPQQVRQFDYRTISDVVIHVDYTARDGGSTFRGDVESNNATALTSTGPWAQLLAIHDAFPNEWEQFLRAPEPGEGPQVLTIPLTLEHLDYLAQQRGVDVEGLSVGLLLTDGATPAALPVTLSPGGATTLDIDGLVLSKGLDLAPAVELGPITLSVDENAAPASLADPDDSGRLDRSKIAGLVLIVHYVHKS